MRYGRVVSLLTIALAAACGTLTESPVAPDPGPGSVRLALFGDPPPPPVDTEVVATFNGEAGAVAGRYFENKPATVLWIEFTTAAGSDVVASPEARLLYNTRTAQTIGVGTLTFGSGAVLDLRLVALVRAGDGSVRGTCPTADPTTGRSTCTITIGRAPVEVDVVP